LPWHSPPLQIPQKRSRRSRPRSGRIARPPTRRRSACTRSRRPYVALDPFAHVAERRDCAIGLGRVRRIEMIVVLPEPVERRRPGELRGGDEPEALLAFGAAPHFAARVRGQKAHVVIAIEAAIELRGSRQRRYGGEIKGASFST